MGCNCGCNEAMTGYPSLLGQLTLAPIKKGGRFQFGYNTGYGTGPFAASEIAQLTNGQGITQGAVSYVLSGTLSYYIAVEGQAGRDYGSASDLRDAIYQAIVGGGYSIDPGSINFNFEPAATTALGPQVIYTGPSAGGGAVPSGPGLFDQISQTLNLPKETAQLVVFGGLALVAIMLIKR